MMTIWSSRFVVAIVTTALLSSSLQSLRPIVESLATLESGQRLIPRYHLKLNDSDGTKKSTTVVNDYSVSPYHSVWDLSRIEQWATERHMTQHHIKTIYRVLKSHGCTIDSVNATSNSTTDASTQYQQEAEDMTVLLQRLQENGFPKVHATEFVQQFRLRTIRLYNVQYPTSSNGTSIKLVFQLPDIVSGKSKTTTLGSDRFIETVIIRHDSNGSRRDTKTFTSTAATGTRVSSRTRSGKNTRYTVCVSSQVGCLRACTFCATGTQMKFHSQLSSSEIVEQVYMAQQVLNQIHRYDDDNNSCSGQDLLRNIVFMGMGEPLDNWEEVYESCRTLTHQRIFAFSPKRITVSTVGVSPNYIRQMTYDAPSLRLAISLHGATQSIREQLMPATKAVHATLQELELAIDDHIKITGQYGGPMIEYLLINDVNDTDEAAQALIDFCQRRQIQQQRVAAVSLRTSNGCDVVIPTTASFTYVNLIPYNPTLVGMNVYQYSTPSDDKIIRFHERLLHSSSNIKSRIRRSSAASRDTNGACGQLALLSSSLTAPI